jgi:hypothetical protein
MRKNTAASQQGGETAENAREFPLAGVNITPLVNPGGAVAVHMTVFRYHFSHSDTTFKVESTITAQTPIGPIPRLSTSERQLEMASW